MKTIRKQSREERMIMTHLETRATVLMSEGARLLNIFSNIRGLARALVLLSSLMVNFLPTLEMELESV